MPVEMKIHIFSSVGESRTSQKKPKVSPTFRKLNYFRKEYAGQESVVNFTETVMHQFVFCLISEIL